MAIRIKKVVRYAIIIGVVVGVGIQFIPVAGRGTNPPDRFPLGAPPEVEAIMRRACLDCHSNETRWPLYARLAPGSWLMSRDVTKGRQHLNFSEWGGSDDEEKKMDRENCWEQVESGAMPPWFYIYPLHMDAKLSEADKATLKGWFMSQQGKDKAAEESAPAADAAGPTGAGGAAK